MKNVHLLFALSFCFLTLTAWETANGDMLKIMSLGDSNTRGTYPASEAGPHPGSIGAGGYRYPLQNKMRDGGYQFDFVGSQTSNAVGEQGDNPPTTWTYDATFDRDHQGLAGFTNAQLLTGGAVPTWDGDPVNAAPTLVNCLSTYQPDIVLLMSGTNGLTSTNIAYNLQTLDNVIRTITTNSPSTRLIVSTIFDRWDTTGNYNTTQAYNAGIPGLVAAAQQRGELVSFVDCGGALTIDDFYFDNGMRDGVHPNPILAMPKVADVWYEGIMAVAPVPEPGTATLFITGLLCLLMGVARKKK